MSLKAWSILPLSLAMTGCVSMAPRYRTPDPPVPKAWPEGPAYKAGAATAPAAHELPWRDFYLDEGMRKVLSLALDTNWDLRIEALRTEQARAYYRIQRSDLLPKVNAFAQGSKQRLPTSVFGLNRAVVFEQDQAGVGISAWELDFFGRVRSLKNQALEQFLATEQAQDSARISLLAEVANIYLALATDRESLTLAQATLASEEASYKLIERRFEVGASSEIDTRRAQVSADAARGDVAAFTRAVAIDRNALDLLVGAPVPAELLPASLASVTPLKDIAPGSPRRS